MAKMRVFLSSTYDDLRTVREVVGSFIDEMGHEPVLFEHGHIPYGSTETLEDDCIDEIKLCDFLVSIVGKRFGTPSSVSNYSISQQEVRKALEFGIRVFTFVEHEVHAEFEVYKHNQEQSITFAHVDDPRVHRFLAELHTVQVPIFSYKRAKDINVKLRMQWSGLLKKFVQADMRKPLAHERGMSTRTLSFTPPPSRAFTHIQQLLQLSKPLAFGTSLELSKQLIELGFEAVEPIPSENMREWVKQDVKGQLVLRVADVLFDDQGRLVHTQDLWHDEWITLKHWVIEQMDRST